MKKKSGKAIQPKKTFKNKVLKKKPQPASAAFPIVGIGASAGGLEASSELLKHLAPNLGMAYVFVHHLSPKFDSHLTEILQRQTSMPVTKVTTDMKVVPNHIYVIPPDTFMSFRTGHLKLEKKLKDETTYQSIDYFLISLANTCQHNAIGILLSGTATDGTLGLKAIKEEGGITFAQDETAQHQQMPANALKAGYVDYVLPPKRITEELAALIRHPFSVTPPNEALAKNENEIKRILAIVLMKYGVDFFSHYKRTTVYRRIIRRMALNKIEKFEQYAKRLREDENETSLLYQDFLINVTSFFREPAFYNALTKVVFPQLIKNRKITDAIRIWISGCATGEEAYSMGICITEFLEKKKIAVPIQIFATDLDETAIEKARLGIYDKNAVLHISPQRLKKFFIRLDGHYQIVKEVRDMCIFSVHNLMKDPPFSRMDLISCQNVLIYIEAGPQRRILQSFHYALKPTGHLLLGKSESIGSATELFQPIEKDSKLYTKKNHSNLPRLDFIVRQHNSSPASPREEPEPRTETDVEKEFDKLLLARYVYPSILVSKDLEILRFRGATSRFFEPASGKASLNLLKMVKDELIFELRGLFQKAKKNDSAVSKKDVTFGKDGDAITIEILPIKSAKEVYFLITFKDHVRELPPSGNKKTKGLKGDPYARILKLEQALKDAQEQIRTTTEDFDVSREELQSANEEILSANEELQSINEELETSKEELQSSNEELTTINEELQNRITELKQSRDYIEAIIETIRGPLLVLSAQQKIRTANKAFFQFFKLDKEETEGRYLSELANGKWIIPALRTHLQEMFPKKINFKDFEINHHFPVIGHRIMVINAHRLAANDSDKETLILLSFEDITRYRQAAQALEHTQEQLTLALEGGKVGTWMWNIKTNEITGSKEEVLVFGMEEDSFAKTFAEWEEMIHPEDLDWVREALQKAIKENTPVDNEHRILWPDKSVHWVLSKAKTYYDKNGQPDRMVGVNIDVTERKRAIEALEESEKRFHTMSDNAPVMIWMSDPEKKCNYLNRTWLNFTGKPLEKELGNGWHDGIHPEDSAQFLKVFNDAYESRTEFKIDYRLKRHDGEYRWIMNHGVPRFARNDVFIGYIGTCIDISERIDLERQKDDFMSIASHELKTPVTSIKAYTQILQQKFSKLNDEQSTGMLTRLDLQIDKLTGLINTLLDVARIQSGQMEYEKDVFDINTFILEVGEEMQVAAPHHEIETNFKTTGKMVGDKVRLAQVLNNLVSNAIKYSRGAGKIIIHSDSDNDNFIITVQDFGAGISKEMQDKIFGRFFRVSEESGNRVSGLGLGLFIASQIVQQQGGKIWLESKPGKGSCFSFSLPKRHDRL
jgi:two-component system CheB/CheR fusion protein